MAALLLPALLSVALWKMKTRDFFSDDGLTDLANGIVILGSQRVQAAVCEDSETGTT